MSDDDDDMAGAVERLCLSEGDSKKLVDRSRSLMDGCIQAMLHESVFTDGISAEEYARTEYAEVIRTLVEVKRQLKNGGPNDKSWLESEVKKLEGLRVVVTETLQRLRRAESSNPSPADLQFIATDTNRHPTMCMEAHARFKDVISEINSGNHPAMLHKIGENLRACGNCNKLLTEMLKCGKCKLAYYCSVECQARMWQDHKHECEMFVDVVEKKRARELRERIRVLSNTLRINANPTTIMFDDVLCAQLNDGGLLWRVREGVDFFTFTHATPWQFFKFCNEHGCGPLAIAERQATARIFFGDFFGVMHVHDGRIVMLWII